MSRDFELTGRARVELLVDVFNLLNRTNVKDINTVWGGIDYPNTPPPPQLGFPPRATCSTRGRCSSPPG